MGCGQKKSVSFWYLRVGDGYLTFAGQSERLCSRSWAPRHPCRTRLWLSKSSLAWLPHTSEEPTCSSPTAFNLGMHRTRPEKLCMPGCATYTLYMRRNVWPRWGALDSLGPENDSYIFRELEVDFLSPSDLIICKCALSKDPGFL